MTEHGYRNPPRSPVRDYLKEQDLREAAQRAAVATNHRLQQSRDWLASYRATSRPSLFNWSGKYPAITQESDHEDQIEAAYHQAGAQAAEVSVGEGVGDTPEECSGKNGGDADAAERREDDAGSDGRQPSFTEPPF